MYFKRSYFRSDVELVGSEAVAQVVPFGLNHACASWTSKRRCLRALFLTYARMIQKAPRLRWPELKRRARLMRVYCLLPDDGNFWQSPSVEVEPAVLYQTRVWAPHETSENIDEINNQRVSLVRALRNAFGSRFLGGLIPTDFAYRNFPDALTNLPWRRKAYAAASRRGLIGVYSRGLHQSLAFKLSEYLAASKCIVSEPLRNELPSPLLEGQNYHVFHSAEECVQQCSHVLENTRAADDMRQANSRYYKLEVSPAAHLLDCLQRAFIHT